MSEQPNPLLWTTDPQLERLENLYAIYRDYMKHEDDLLNQRSTWHLLIQGFLFATLGVVGQWQLVPGVPDHLYLERGFLVYVLGSVGASIAILATVSASAANDAIDSLCEKWTLVSSQFRIDTKGVLPELAGGGHRSAKKRGKLPALYIPALVASAWIVIMLMAVRDHVHPLIFAHTNDSAASISSASTEPAAPCKSAVTRAPDATQSNPMRVNPSLQPKCDNKGLCRPSSHLSAPSLSSSPSAP